MKLFPLLIGAAVAGVVYLDTLQGANRFPHITQGRLISGIWGDMAIYGGAAAFIASKLWR